MSIKTERRLFLRFLQICVAGIVVTMACYLAVQLLLYERFIWTVQTVLEGNPVSITIVHRRQRSFLQIGHDFLITGRGDHYTTTLEFPDGRKLTFQTTKQPRAIWEAGASLWVACYDGIWLLGKLDVRGNLTPVPKNDLPSRPPCWNLEEQSDKVQNEWNVNYDMWCN